MTAVNKSRAFVLLLAEKVGFSFTFTFVAILMTGGTASLYVRQQWLTSLDGAAYAAVLALLTGAVTSLLTLKLSGFADAGLRIVLQYLQSFIGAAFASANGFVSDVHWLGAAAIAFAATLPTVLKVLIALQSQFTPAASLVPYAQLERAA